MPRVDRSPDVAARTAGDAPDDPEVHRDLRVLGLPAASSEWVALGGLAAIGVAFVLSPEHAEDGPVLCPFRRLTGLPCPGCGLTRSFVYLAHGWWRHAFEANPFGVVMVAAIVALAGAVVVARVRRRPPPNLDLIARRPWVRAVLAVWLVFAVVRIGCTI